jgi:hypothetical protein
LDVSRHPEKAQRTTRKLRANRRAFVMELDALYCDVIVRRFEQFTGKKAKRQRQAAA